jgi:hypothetical protein
MDAWLLQGRAPRCTRSMPREVGSSALQRASELPISSVWRCIWTTYHIAFDGARGPRSSARRRPWRGLRQRQIAAAGGLWEPDTNCPDGRAARGVKDEVGRPMQGLAQLRASQSFWATPGLTSPLSRTPFVPPCQTRPRGGWGTPGGGAAGNPKNTMRRLRPPKNLLCKKVAQYQNTRLENYK